MQKIQGFGPLKLLFGAKRQNLAKNKTTWCVRPIFGKNLEGRGINFRKVLKFGKMVMRFFWNFLNFSKNHAFGAHNFQNFNNSQSNQIKSENNNYNSNINNAMIDNFDRCLQLEYHCFCHILSCFFFHIFTKNTNLLGFHTMQLTNPAPPAHTLG